MDLSVVTTLYQSGPYLMEFYTRIRTAAERIASTFEIVLVNDGSSDDSLAIALSLFQADPRESSDEPSISPGISGIIRL